VGLMRLLSAISLSLRRIARLYADQSKGARPGNRIPLRRFSTAAVKRERKYAAPQDQVSEIRVPIKSAGHTKLTGAEIRTRPKDGSPWAKLNARWWLKCASTPAKYSPTATFQTYRLCRGCFAFVAANEKTRRPYFGSPGGPIMISPGLFVVTTTKHLIQSHHPCKSSGRSVAKKAQRRDDTLRCRRCHHPILLVRH
jgi:hypothetical protein